MTEPIAAREDGEFPNEHPRNIIEHAEIIQYRDGWRLILCRREVTAHATEADAIAHLAAAEQATLVAP